MTAGVTPPAGQPEPHLRQAAPLLPPLGFPLPLVLRLRPSPPVENKHEPQIRVRSPRKTSKRTLRGGAMLRNSIFHATALHCTGWHSAETRSGTPAYHKISPQMRRRTRDKYSQESRNLKKYDRIGSVHHGRNPGGENETAEVSYLATFIILLAVLRRWRRRWRGRLQLKPK